MSRTSQVLLAVVTTGAPAAVVWLLVGRPSQWAATDRGLILTESNAAGQFQVVTMFTLIGIVVGVVVGPLVHRWTRPAGWQLVVALAAASTAAALVCWRVGVWFGPGPLQDATGLEPGDTVAAPFGVDAVVPFLVWPLASVVSYTLALYLSSDGVDREAEFALDGSDDLDGVSERSTR